MLRFSELLLGLAVPCILVLPESSLAEKRTCVELGQTYEQIARDASTLELNNILFLATDRGCPGAAKLALDNGASLEARDRIGAKPVILLAYSSYAVVCLGFGFASSPWHAWALFFLYGVHSATVNPASRALVAGLSRTRSRGTALGVYHTSVGIAVLPASLLAGVLWDTYGAHVPFIIAGTLALIASVAMSGLRLDGSNG